MSKFLFYDFAIPDLIADQDKAVGGATIQALNWIYGLIENGHEVGVLIEKNQPTPQSSSITFIETFSLQHDQLLGWVNSRPRSINRAIKSFNPDFIIQAGAGFITFPLALLAKFNSTPFIHRVANDADVDKRVFRKASFFAVLFYKVGVRLSPILSCQNQYQVDQLCKRYPHKKVFKLHNPFDGVVSKGQNVPRKERKYVAWVGIFQFQKNLPLLFDIAAALPKVEFRVAGKPKLGIDEALQTTLKQLDDLSNVVFVGFLSRKDLPSFLEKAICLLNTSHYEGFSNTFLEALSVGTPIVAPKNVDPDYFVHKHQLGNTSASTDQLFETLQKFLASEDWEGFSSRCRAYLPENHDRKYLSKKLVHLLLNSTSK